MAIQIWKHANGLIDANQGEHFGHRITYNPDDARFYVHAPGDDDEVVATCGTKAEAVYVAMVRSEA